MPKLPESARRYRMRAEEFRRRSGVAANPELMDRYMDLAEAYDRLAQREEGSSEQ